MGSSSRFFGRRAALAIRVALCATILAIVGPSPLLRTAQGQTASNYTVNVGDVLKVSVEDRADISGDYSVDKNGTITLKLLGAVPVSGRTTMDISTDIARRMSLITSEVPLVVVTVSDSQTRQYFVLGAVLLPGMYVFSEPPTVWEAISEAGGPANEADMTAVAILSRDRSDPTIVDLGSVGTADISKLPRLRPGDTVRVPRKSVETSGSAGVVYVFGAVGSQGPQPLSENPDLASLMLTSIPTPDANLRDVDVVRKEGHRLVHLKVDLERYFGEGEAASNIRLRDEDTIRVARARGGFGPLAALGALATVVGLATSILVLAR